MNTEIGEESLKYWVSLDVYEVVCLNYILNNDDFELDFALHFGWVC